MKKCLFFFVMILCAGALRAQVENPVHITTSVVALEGQKYAIHITATMDKGWHVYSQQQPEDAIAVPTTFTFATNPLVVLQGKVKEVGKLEKFTVKDIGATNYQYEGKIDFVQVITLKAKVKAMLNGTITYQTCTGERCLAPKTVPFTIDLGK